MRVRVDVGSLSQNGSRVDPMRFELTDSLTLNLGGGAAPARVKNPHDAGSFIGHK